MREPRFQWMLHLLVLPISGNIPQMVLGGLTDSCNVMVCIEELVHNNTQVVHCRFRLNPLDSNLDKVQVRHKVVFRTNNKKFCLVLI